ncbi:MAG: hypothetical protein ABIH87_00530 [bacterium]
MFFKKKPKEKTIEEQRAEEIKSVRDKINKVSHAFSYIIPRSSADSEKSCKQDLRIWLKNNQELDDARREIDLLSAGASDDELGILKEYEAVSERVQVRVNQRLENTNRALDEKEKRFDERETLQSLNRR